MRTLSNLHAGLFIFTRLIPLAVQVGIKVLSPETTASRYYEQKKTFLPVRSNDFSRFLSS